MLIRARHYATGQPVDVVCEGGKIASIDPQSSKTRPGACDVDADWVAPALFDLQINGCDGHSFNSEKLTADNVRHVVEVSRRHGIGALCPTLITNARESIIHGMATIRAACDVDRQLAEAIPGIHLEGPYISPEDGPRGAHPRQHVRAPAWDEFRRFQEAAGGRIRLVTLAPEHDGAVKFIEQLVQSGVVVSIGHTAATPAHIQAAITAGAKLSTHLGNGSHAVLPRHENYIWEQLAADELWASIICDGHHLPPSVVRCIVRVKTPARLVLTCDARSLAGLPAGRYHEWEQDFDILPTGKIVVAGTSYLGGSGDFTDRCVDNVIRFAGVSLREAVDMASARPRELLRLPSRPFEVGAPADLVLFNGEPGHGLRVRATIVSGETQYKSN
jgi:N-acetylglucosamine-6-phosphate deacetylase